MTQQNSPGNRKNFLLTLALWTIFGVIYFILITQGLGFNNAKAENYLVVSVISVLSFAVGNTLALLDLRRDFSFIAWRPAYTLWGIIVALGVGVLMSNLPSATIYGLLTIIIMRFAFGPNTPKGSRNAKDLGV